MARSSLAPQHTARARQPQDAPDSQHLHDPAVLPFRSEFNRRRMDVSNALRRLADSWSALEIRDEASWAAYAADAGMALTRHLVQHAVSVHAAMVESGYTSPTDDVSAADDIAFSLEDADDQDDCAAEPTETAADAVLVAFIGVINTLTSDGDVSALDDVAKAASVTDSAAATLDVRRTRNAARQAS